MLQSIPWEPENFVEVKWSLSVLGVLIVNCCNVAWESDLSPRYDGKHKVVVDFSATVGGLVESI